MTKEQQIDWLCRLKSEIKIFMPYQWQKPFQEALDMSIQALENEPTTKNVLVVDREDAVERLNALKQFIGYDEDSEIVKATQKSLDMAIIAIEHPERNVVAIVPCGDAISRAEVLKLMQDNWHTHNGDWAMQESMDDIRALPSVTPIRPKGHWFVDERPESDREIICSNCEQPIFKYHKMDFDYRPKYCPNCGADMRGTEE